MSAGLAAGRYAWLHSLLVVRVNGLTAAGLCAASCGRPGCWRAFRQGLSGEAGGSERELGPGLQGSASGVVRRLVMAE